MADIVLVHGAWHGAWCWYKVIPLLAAAGHQVHAIDLPGHGIDRTPTREVSLSAYADRVAAVLDDCAGPALLVGHSMGGAVISQAAELRPSRVLKLVYVAAFLLEDGVSLSDEAAKDPQSVIPEGLLPQSDGSLLFRMNKVREAFYGDCSDADIALCQALLVPQAGRVFRTPVQLSAEGWGRVPRSYIEATGDRAITLDAQRLMHQAQPCEDVFTLETSHSPFLSQPAALADLLLGCLGRGD